MVAPRLGRPAVSLWLGLLAALVGTAHGYQNPVVGSHAKDPTVMVEAGTYHLFSSFTGDVTLAGNVPLQVSTDLQTWHYLGDALPELPVWVDPLDAEVRGPGTLTRPSLGRYLLYFSARHRDDGSPLAGRRCIGVVASDDPTMLLDGAPSLIAADAPIVCGADTDAFDPFVFTAAAPNGDPYAWLIWVERAAQQPDVIRHQLLQPDGSDVVAAIPALPLLVAETFFDFWEHGRLANPSIVRDPASGGHLLFYSGNEDYYSLDMPEVHSPPTPNPGISGSNWATCIPTVYGVFLPCERNERRPWLRTNNGAWRPGDADFFRDPDGHLWMVYNASVRTNVFFFIRYETPTLRLDKVCVSPGGTPRTLAPTTAPQSLARSADCAADVPLFAEPWPAADQLFLQDPRWRGGDGAWSIDLGGERSLWMFGDSFIDPEGETRSSSFFIRNSIAIQQGADPSTAHMTFHWGLAGAPPRPIAYFPNSGGHWYWAAGGAVAGGKLILFQSGNRLDGQGQVAFAPPKAVLIANYQDDPSLWQQQWVAIPQSSNGFYCSGHAFVSGSYVYVYSTRPSLSGSGVAAAHCRYPITQAKNGNFTKPQWWTGAQYNVHGDAEVLWDQTAQYSVHQLPQGDYLAVMGAAYPGFGRYATAADRNGPFSPFTSFYPPPEATWWGDGGGVVTYIYHAHPQLTGAPVVVTYSTHGSALIAYDDSPYYPKFVRFSPP